MSQTVIGIFKSASEANNAVSQLINTGFSEQDVDVISGSSTDYATEDYTKDKNKETDTSGNGVSRFFKNLFSNEDESQRYSTAAQRGSVVTVHAKSIEEAQQAATLLDEYGATDVDGKDAYDNSSAETYNSNKLADDNDQKISVIEENMQVGKREVKTGGVRVRSRIVEKPVEESLRLREERVTVQRNKVDRAVTDADLNNFKESTIELKEHAEVPVVSKEARVVEEISVGKKVNERKETIRGTVRNTEVDVENIEGINNSKSKNTNISNN